MDLQYLLCGFGPEGLTSKYLQLPNLRRIRSIRRRRVRTNGSKVAPKGPKPKRAGRRHLPVGRGKYTVGCVDVMSDYSVKGTFIRLYYPTNSKDVYKREVQWPLWLPRKQYGHGYAYFRRKNMKVFGAILNWLGGDVYVPVLWQAPLIENNSVFPVVVFTHGLGGNRTTYSTICSDIASHGYIVAVLEHRDGSASTTYCFIENGTDNNVTLVEYNSESENSSDEGAVSPISELPSPTIQQNAGFQEQWLLYDRQEKEDDFGIRNKQVYMRVEEIRRTVDLLEALNTGKEVRNVLGLHFDLRQLKGCMDLNRVAVVGHSFGGATTIAALALEKRFRCGVALDSWMLPLDEELYKGVDQPLLLINTETFQWPDNVRDMYKLDVNEQRSDRILITIRGTCHQSHSDFQFFVPSKLAKLLEMRHTLSPKIAMEINNKAMMGFLSKHLDIPDADYHDNLLSGEHPLIILGTNLDISMADQGHVG